MAQPPINRNLSEFSESAFASQQSVELAIELKQALQRAEAFCNIDAIYQIKNFALALEAYGTSKLNLSAVYRTPPSPAYLGLDFPLNITVRETFDLALNEGGIFESIQKTQNCQRLSKSSQKQQVLSAVISVSERALTFISCRLQRSPCCTKSIDSDNANSTALKVTKIYSRNTS